jgi:IS1 family transposase
VLALMAVLALCVFVVSLIWYPAQGAGVCHHISPICLSKGIEGISVPRNSKNIDIQTVFGCRPSFMGNSGSPSDIIVSSGYRVNSIVLVAHSAHRERKLWGGIKLSGLNYLVSDPQTSELFINPSGSWAGVFKGNNKLCGCCLRPPCAGCLMKKSVAPSEPHIHHNPRSLAIDESIRVFIGGLRAVFGRFSSLFSLNGLKTEDSKSYNSYTYEEPFWGCVPLWRVIWGILGLIVGNLIMYRSRGRLLPFGVGFLCFAGGSLVWLTGHTDCDDADAKHGKCPFHNSYTVPQKTLDKQYYCGTLMSEGNDMGQYLSTDKQAAIIANLAEGSSIRAIERITGVHRDTIMRLGVRVGQGCAKLLDAKMRGLNCRHLQFDELWGFIGKKQRHMRPDDNPTLGDVWTFCAIDSDTKVVPSFKVGKRDTETANAFVSDVASRVTNRVQISSDGLNAYVGAIENAFGADVNFAQVWKKYLTDDSLTAERRYSAPEFVVEEKRAISGRPDLRMASTSHVERLNGTTRLHMRRLTRLTYAFSKKRENFEAAVALHFAYYNLVLRHITLRCTPAMAAGIERDFWTVRNLVEAVA